MTKPIWTFQKTPRMGGATGEAFVNTLYGTGMKPAAVLAREAIQNSVDASKPRGNEKVKIVFRRVSLMGKEKAAFTKSLGLDTEFVSRESVLGFQQDHCIASMNRTDEPLRLLYIEDYGTHGLYGAPHDSNSHLFRLLLSLGDGAKSRGKEGSGGSYGYGKSVYSSNSRIHTIVAYSTFNPKDDKSKYHARLMGCAYFNAHEHDGDSYSGRAWFGIPITDNGQEVDPLQDEASHKMAEALGFRRRDSKSTGTSILIVDCGVDCEELRASIEEWWWPRILDESLGLDVMLYEQDQLVQPPRPRSRLDLKPFIHCFEMAIGRSQPAGKHDKAGSMNKFKDVPLGNYGYCALEEKDLESEALQEKSGCIALIRGPRMIVSYMEVGGTLPLPCVGTFVASSEVDQSLKISEPPAHDKWDSNSARLQSLPEEKHLVVSHIIARLKHGFRKFANEAAPPAPKQDLRLKSLERLLGNMFKPPTTGPGGGGAHPADPIEIKFLEQPHVIADGIGLRTRGSFRLGLGESADKQQTQVSVEVECLVVEDESVSKEDPITTSLSTVDVEYDADQDNPGCIVFRLDKDSKPVFTFTTGIYRPDWTTRIRVMVKEST